MQSLDESGEPSAGLQRSGVARSICVLYCKLILGDVAEVVCVELPKCATVVRNGGASWKLPKSV